MFKPERRTLLTMGLAAAGAAMLPGWSVAQGGSSSGARGMRLILLGTKGGPRIGGSRSNPANLLLINGVPYVIDCGTGVSRQLVNAHVPLARLRYVFITHHHSDHNLEYGNLIYNAWATGLNQQVDVFGPKGTEAMTRTYWELNRFDIETRMADEGRPDLRKLVLAKDVLDNGVVLQNADVQVTAFRTPHPPIVDNFAYRFESADRSIVFSSDTAYNPRLAEFARGADVLVHEAMYGPGIDALVARVANGATIKKHFLASHTLTEDVGRVAAAAGVKTLVLSHFVPGDDDSITDDMWAQDVRKHYKGRIVVGRDLMEI
ncbi:MBL fold metallo-hydrolase [Cupriavidus sp. TMH.W2]|uniref:MBL fold metallo-hydrolase n=1 Tax=Cupriavidus sp. TMH.W2 TaxID=3434465 RepID=UPI003D785553